MLGLRRGRRRLLPLLLRGQNWNINVQRPPDLPYSTVLRHQPCTSLKLGSFDSALCCSWMCDGIPLHPQVPHSGVAKQLFRGWPIRSRKRSQHTAFAWRGLILYQASIEPWRACSSIKEKLTRLLIAVVREVDLSCQMYGDDYWSSSPGVSVSFTHAALRYGFVSGFSVFIFNLLFGSFTLDVYASAISSLSLSQRCANHDCLLVIFPLCC